MSKKPIQYCCYCGINLATTKDHIPPRGIFNKPRPHNLITVPSCSKCNNGASGLDELFKIYLGMHVAKFSNEGEQLFKKGVLPTINHTKSFKNKILSSVKPIYIVDQNGNVVDINYSVLWNSEAHDAVIERITRGLFFNHYNSIISDNAKVYVYYFDKPTDIFRQAEMVTVSIADNAFIYSYAKVDDVKYSSLWLYQFYRSHWAGAIVMEDF